MEDAAFIQRLRDGDARAYRELVLRHNAGFVRLARAFCGIRATAEEVVQDAWVVVFTSLDSYAGVSPLRAWIAGIVVNKARSRAQRDGRMKTFSDFIRDEMGADTSSLEDGRFTSAGAWETPPMPWDGLTPEREAGDRQLLSILGEALETLPPVQRAIVLLRDVEGHDPAEICRMLDISEGNLRVLLHRARTRLRGILDTAMAPRTAPRAVAQP
jgi:RNA polymerase sigma-70 factor (ECF subfamily)